MEQKSQQTISASIARARGEIRSKTQSGGAQIYQAGLDLQRSLYESNLTAKEKGRQTENTLLFCEHEPTYTLGKSGDRANMLFDPAAVGAAFYQIERGGDITYHGPGQLVVYPIFDLDALGFGVSEFVMLLEEAVIKSLAHYQLIASRLDGAPGIWLHLDSRPLKICAIGLKISRGCTMHGIAINVTTDLKYFDYIVPCGLADKGVTSLENELGSAIPIEEVRAIFEQCLAEVMALKITPY